MAAFFYSGRPVWRIRMSEIEGYDPHDFVAVIGVQCDELIGHLCERSGIREADIERQRYASGSTLFLWVRPPP